PCSSCSSRGWSTSPRARPSGASRSRGWARTTPWRATGCCARPRRTTTPPLRMRSTCASRSRKKPSREHGGYPPRCAPNFRGRRSAVAPPGAGGQRAPARGESMSTESHRAIEAVLMVAEQPVEPHLLAQLLEVSPARVEELCTELAAAYESDDRGFVLVRVAGGYRFQSHPDL